MNTFQETFTVPEKGLSAAGLFHFLQEASGHHSASLNQGQAALVQKGLMWVVIRNIARMARWPEPGEALQLLTWPAAVRHGMCPRYYHMTDAEGNTILDGSAIWAVVDRETRSMVNPDERGVFLEPAVTGLETPLPMPIRRPATEHETLFTVPEAYLDENGHMNNTRYYDLAMQVTGLRPPFRELRTEYINEALCGQELTVRWGTAGDTVTVVGERDGSHVFRMQLSR